jgi:hypothetical protein
MAKKTKTAASRMSEAADIADDLIAEGWDDQRIALLAEQFLQLRAEYVRLHSLYHFGRAA